jgi:hypothetical protein
MVGTQSQYILDLTKKNIILLTGDGQIEIDLLQRLAITPAVCYARVRQRWDEFQLFETTQRRRE